MPTLPNLADWLKTADIFTSKTGMIFVSLMQDGEFRAALTEIIENPQTGTFLAHQGALILGVWFLRAWRLGKAASWGQKLFTQAWIGGLYWGCALLVIPMLVWGEAYGTVVSNGLRSVFRVIFA